MAIDPAGGHPAMDYPEHLRTYSGVHQRHDRHDRVRRAASAVPVVPRALGVAALSSIAAAARSAGSQPGKYRMVTIAVTAERDGEPRVAVSPETVKKLTASGLW